MVNCRLAAGMNPTATPASNVGSSGVERDARVVQGHVQRERAAGGPGRAAEGTRSAGGDAAVQLDAVHAKGGGADAAQVRDGPGHVHRVPVDERRPGPAGVRHRGGVGDAASVGHVLVDLDRDRGRGVVDLPAAAHLPGMAERVIRSDLEGIGALDAGGSVARIELEDVDVSARRSRRRQRLPSREQPRRGDGGIRRRWWPRRDRRRAAVREGAGIRRGVARDGDVGRLVVEVHVLRGARRHVPGGRGGGDGERERRRPAGGPCRSRQREGERVFPFRQRRGARRRRSRR